MNARIARSLAPSVARRGVALAAVLYFLVLAALTSIAVVFGTRAAAQRAGDSRTDAALVGAADLAVHSALARWNGADRDRQPVGTTVIEHPPGSGELSASLAITRLQLRIFSLVADVRAAPGGAGRRVALLVRVPIPAQPLESALVSAVDVSVGDSVSFVADTGRCATAGAVAITRAPQATLFIDPAIPVEQQPVVRVDSAAAASATYLRLGGWSWADLARRADVQLAADATMTPAPIVAGGTCTDDASNWGEPNDAASPCGARAPLVYAPGDLTIAGGRGQGALLVDGRLVIAGPFTYSGQIVVRRGIETRGAAISISGLVSAWRATSDSSFTRAARGDVVLTHGTVLRYSRCDAAHGIESWLQPRAVRAHAWTELF